MIYTIGSGGLELDSQGKKMSDADMRRFAMPMETLSLYKLIWTLRDLYIVQILFQEKTLTITSVCRFASANLDTGTSMYLYITLQMETM